jgi:hypothetical protein
MQAGVNSRRDAAMGLVLDMVLSKVQLKLV